MRKIQLLHEYKTNLDKNLDTRSFGHAEQLYLILKRLFTLIKVSKLRLKLSNRISGVSIITKKCSYATNINPGLMKIEL